MATRELFLIDGNSLAYRAFFALPESIATSDGRPTNAIFGFASMLVKILTEYGPKATIVVWDAGMSGREEEYEPYKAERKPRPDLLREQWPHLEPLVEAFGYTQREGRRLRGRRRDRQPRRAGEGGRHRRHGRDRRPRRLPAARRRPREGDDDLARDHRHARLRPRGRDRALRRAAGAGARLHRPEGRHLRQHPRRARASATRPPLSCSSSTGRSRRCSPTSTRSPARSARRTCARTASWRASRSSSRPSSATSTTGIDVTEVVAEPPDRSRLREVFRDFELRDPLRRLEEALGLEDAAPRLRRASSGWRCGTRAGELSSLPAGPAAVALAADGPRLRWAATRRRRGARGRGRRPRRASSRRGATARWSRTTGSRRAGRSLRRWPRTPSGRVAPAALAHDVTIAAYLLNPARRTYPLAELAEEAGIDVDAGDEEDPEAALAAEAATVHALAELQRPQIEELGLRRLFEEVELPLVEVLCWLERVGREAGHVPAGGDRGGCRGRDRGAPARDLGACGRGVHARLAAAAEPDPVREARASRASGVARPGSRPTRASCERSATSTRSSPRSSPGGSCPSSRAPTSTRFRVSSLRTRAGCTRRSTRPRPPPAGCRAPTPTSRTSRSARSWGARSEAASWPSRDRS